MEGRLAWTLVPFDTPEWFRITFELLLMLLLLFSKGLLPLLLPMIALVGLWGILLGG